MMTGEARQRYRRGLLRPRFCRWNHLLLPEHLRRLHHSRLDALDSGTQSELMRLAPQPSVV